MRVIHLIESCLMGLYGLVSVQMDLVIYPFLVHALLEIPASLNFLLNPSGQLGVYSPQAHPVIRQYAVLLLSSILIALSFALRDADELSGQVAGALAIYHLAPILRAAGRLTGRQAVWQPLLFLASHGFCLAGLLACCWECYLEKLFARLNGSRILTASQS
jgi:uncharacterized membrane protein